MSISSSALVTSVAQGSVKGLKCANYLGKEFIAFLGIPYAKPPIGKLRFKPPEEPEPWTGIHDGTIEGPSCPANHMFFRYFCGDEDNCLNLNIYTPQLPNETVEKPKPVMVWIHGGGFTYGSNKREMYGPKALMMEDIVLVAINYRVGLLGFLSLEDPKLGVPGNMGLKDMVAALKWIQTNIVHFNGDPNNVTVFGESAGSAAVHYLILSPLSKGLIHKAILQSGCALNCWARGTFNGKKIAKYLNFNFEEQGEAALLDHLRNLPPHKIVKAQHTIPDPFCADYERPMGPVIEKPGPGAFLTEDPIELMRSGRFLHIPIIIGYNSNEGLFYEAVRKVFPSITQRINLEREIPYELGVLKGTPKSMAIVKKLAKFYYPDAEPSTDNLDRLHIIKTDNHFAYDIYRTINYQKRQSPHPIYVYVFSADTKLNFMKPACVTRHIYALFACYFLLTKFGGSVRNLIYKLATKISSDQYNGVCHADDLGYLFDNFLTPPNLDMNSSEFLVAKRLVRMWANFAAYGQPTTNSTDEILAGVEWKPVEVDGANFFLDIGNETLVLGQNPDDERMKFWDGIYNNINNK